jgi:hypothetical protein
MGGGPGYTEITVNSGVPHKVAKHWACCRNGNTNPYTLKITKRPSHGTVKIQESAGVSKIIYQSKTGFKGKDNFAYVRVSADRFGGTYTVAVTVK